MKWLASIMIALLLLISGCGTNEQDSGGAELDIEVTLEKTNDNQYQLAVYNHTSKDVTLTFPSSQRYDFSMIDSDEEIQYTYSANKSFAMVVEEVSIKPGDSLEFDLDLTEALTALPSGDYTLQAWVTANEIGEEMVSTSLSR